MLYAPTSLGMGPNNRWNPNGEYPTKPTNVQGTQNLFNSAVNTQAADYDSLMGRYKDYLSKLSSGGGGYEQSQDSKNSLNTLNDLSTSGGFSGSDVADMRERGISPIRAVYAGANRDIDRQKSLQGGVSPNYTAAKAKLTRGLASQIADQTTKVNADIAERVAGNKISAAGTYGSAAGSENTLRNISQQQQQQLTGDALRGATSLYGTTPALSQLFGNQALQSANLQSGVNQNNQRSNMDLIGRLVSGLG